MIDINKRQQEKSGEHVLATPNDVRQLANDLYEKALNDAKTQLHPLLRNVEIQRLAQRNDFLLAFKGAVEQSIARTLAAWQPGVQAVFQFDETRTENLENWDGSIHLLIKVPRLSKKIKAMGKTLDKALVKRLKQLGFSCFEKRQSVLDVQQVMPNELRHGIGYGAMFCAVYTVPLKVWPSNS